MSASLVEAMTKLREIVVLEALWPDAHWRAVAQDVLAAYDAAKGGHVETLDKARVVEVLRAKHDAAEDVASVSDDADSDTHALQVDLIRETVESIAGDLGLTLDAGGGK